MYKLKNSIENWKAFSLVGKMISDLSDTPK